MDVQQIRQLKPMLRRYLNQFDDCFARKDTRAHLSKYVEGQLSDLERKSVEPMALKVGVPVRTLQEFLSQHCWDNDRMRDRLQEIVVRDHAGPHSIGIVDETSFVKKGDKTPGVQRQHCGAVGNRRTASSPYTWHMPLAIFTVCWMGICSCQKAGRTIGRDVVKLGFPRRSSTDPKARLPWNSTTEPWPTESRSTG